MNDSERMARLPKLGGITELRFPPSWALPAHAHGEYNEMILIVSGRIETRIRGEVIDGRVGSVLVYPRGVAHAERAVGGRPLRMLYAHWNDEPESEWPLMSVDPHGRIGLVLRWMLDLGSFREPGVREMAALLFRAALEEFGRGSGRTEDDAVLRVRRHVREHLAEPLRLADLARTACMSPYHFTRVFRRATGLAPMQYVRQARVDAARSLLLASPLPLKAIAPLTGFRDEFHLSRIFRLVTGVSPGSVRPIPR